MRLKLYVMACVTCMLGACAYEDELLESLDQTKETNATATRAAIVPEEWDWTNPANYDYAYIQGVGKIPISSPFTTAASANGDINMIIRGQDFWPEQGWVLLDKVFGTEEQYAETDYPHFMLYNKYRGIIRLFIFNGSSQESKQGIITMNWFGSNTNGLLANTFDYALPVSSPSATDKDHSVINYIQDYYGKAWCVTDFLVAFDPRTDSSKDYALEFKLYSQNESTIRINGEMKFETQSATSLGENTPNTSSGFSLAMVGKALGKLPDGKTITDTYKAINGLTKDGYRAERKLKAKMNNVQSELEKGSFIDALGNVVSAAKGLGSIVSSVFNVVDIFIGKRSSISKVEIMPMVSEGNSHYSGTITTTGNASRFILQLPNTNHWNSDGTVINDGCPIYDKPLGVFCLENEPEIQRLYVVDSYERHYNDDDYDQHYWYTSFRITGDIKLAINKASGLEYVAGTAQLLTPGGMPNSKYDEVEDPMTEDIYMTLLRNDEKRWNGTHPVPLEKLKNTVLLATGKEKAIYLKLNLVLKVVDGGEDTPVVVSQIYKIENTKAMGESGSYTSRSGKKGDRVSKGTPYPFSPYQAKGNTLPATKETNALTLSYY